MFDRIFLFILCSAMMVSGTGCYALDGTVRQPAVSGIFYPSDPDILSIQVENFVNMAARDTSSVNVKGKITGVIAPHAGYVYSGPVAGYAYRHLRGLYFDTVIILGPIHEYRPGGIYLSGADYFSTPLGDAKIDKELENELRTRVKSIRVDPSAHAREHSIEVQVPFIQVVLGKGTMILPIGVRELSSEELQALVDALADAGRKKRVLLIASTDMSHYHPGDEASRIDRKTIEIMESLDSARLMEHCLLQKGELCGLEAVLVMFEVAKKLGATKVYPVKYMNSGDTAGSPEKVVGYGALLIVNEKEENIMTDGELTKEEQKEVLEIARKTLESYIREKKVPEIVPKHERLKIPKGAFVTLKIDGELRGCIGYIEAIKPLYQTIQDMAVSASTRDPRFPPVTVSELPKIKIEVSVLSPVTKCPDINEIVIGKHGLIVRKGFHQGLLLPQVPVEWNWDRDTFLSQTCVKAGLSPDEWKKGVEIFWFSAQVFGEE